MVDIQVVFDAGSARDEGKAGLALLTNTLLESGTVTLSADAVAERLDAVGAQLGSGASQDMAWVSLRSLSDPQYFKPSVDILAQILREPDFIPESLARERKRMIAAVREKSQSPSAIAELAFYKALYGEHPYAFPPGGDEASLNAIEREDVESFYRRYYVAANAVVAIVGDLDRPDAERLATQLIGQLRGGQTASPLPEPAPVNQSRLIHVSHPSSQTHIFMGQLGVARKDPDYFRLYLGNHVLGGNGLVSVLAEEVREKRGLSYGVSSYFIPLRVTGPFVINLQTRNDQAAEAQKIATSTLLHFIHEGPPPEMLAMARDNIIGGFALRIDNNSKLLRYLAVIGFYSLPLDHLQTFITKIGSLSAAEVSEALRRRIDPERLITVVVGGS